MPHVIVKLWPGKSEQQKTQLAEQIVKDVMESLGSKKETISVAIEEFDPQEWTDKVYDPDIVAKENTLYKRPGYGSLA
jgi:4-oxalocrotonate tautomerase